jgi:hypothetical protein
LERRPHRDAAGFVRRRGGDDHGTSLELADDGARQYGARAHDGAAGLDFIAARLCWLPGHGEWFAARVVVLARRLWIGGTNALPHW